MLTPWEQGLFVVLAVCSLALTALAARRALVLLRDGDALPPALTPRRALGALFNFLSQRPVFTARPRVALFHAFVAWGFIYYGLVNVGDVLEGFLPDYRFLGHGWVAGLYRLGADLLSVGVLVGVVYLAHRRFVRRPRELTFSPKIMLHPRALAGIRRDSAIVLAFIFLHVGSRFLGQSVRIAREGWDAWQPLAATLSLLWQGLPDDALVVMEHVTWWLALGLILAFLPYFPYSKHLHLVMAPLNMALKPARPALGSPDPIPLNGDGADPSRLGAQVLTDLTWPRVLDGLACIMCNRCQDVCPAYAAGTRLSPAALEVNKRFAMKEAMAYWSRPARAPHALLEEVMPADGVWACTTCAACVEICPVANEPLQDLFEMRRALVMREGRPPTKAGQTLRNIRYAGNPWGYNPEERGDWALDLNVPLLRDVGECEVLFWPGCHGSFDPRGKEIARAVVRLLQKAGVKVAILGEEAWCTGDPARRLGDEALFQQCARRNASTFARYRFKTIVTPCPHCFNALGNEYRALGIDLNVMHHTQYLRHLVAAGKLTFGNGRTMAVTFHDPCYLGRHNGEVEAPRALLAALPGVTLREMPRHGTRSFCCGGGGGGVFFDVESDRRIPDIRLEEARALEPDTVVTACPFCMTMFEGSTLKEGLDIRDIAEVLVERMDDGR